MKIGVNTFGLGPYLLHDEELVWEGLRKAGVTAIEPNVGFGFQLPPTPEIQALQEKGIYRGFYDASIAAEFITDLREKGFAVYSFHLQTRPLTGEILDEVIPFMEENDLQYCIYSFMERSVEKIAGYADILRYGVQEMRRHGKELLVHNHAMEWLPDGDICVMRWLLDNIPELCFEIDLGWTEYAGVHCTEILRQYPERFPLIHLKEIARGVQAQTGKPFCTVPGEDLLPLPEIMETLRTLTLSDHALIIDQDNSINGDIVKDIAEGILNIQKYM